MVAELNRAQLASGMAEKLKQHKERARYAYLAGYRAFLGPLFLPCARWGRVEGERATATIFFVHPVRVLF